MKRGATLVSALVALACLVLLPASASAQSTIAGVVKDATGGIMPGVTVEASSDVLIEKVRTVVTDDSGQYKIVDLRPGIYTVTFTLTGFSTVRREGVDLPASFTATINADLRIGTLEETVVVTGESPIVDVQNTVHTQVLNRDTLDTIPTGRSIQGLGQLVTGINLNIPDVGGSRAMQQTYMSTHGMPTANTTVLVDGMMVNGLQGDGAIQSYFNDAMSQEVSYQTSGIGADTSAGGVRLNMIPRDGGNRFSGSFYSVWKDGAWQGDNFTQRLKDRGLASPSAIDRIYDFNVAQGGPIMRDKVWFFASARAWSVDAPIAGTLNDNGSPGIDDQKIKSGLVRMTWQVSPRHKFSAYFDEIDKYRGHAMAAGDDPETASVVWGSPAYHTASAKWTSTMSNRLLVEGGWSSNIEYYTNKYQPGIEQPRGTAEWYAGASRLDLDRVTRTGAPTDRSTQSPARYNMQTSASYVTGAHNFKTGLQYTWGTFRHTRDANADLTQQYRSGVPNTVVIRNTPYQSQERLNGDLGIYAQDQWTFKRLTLNAGLRWERINAEVSEQTSPQGRFVPARQFAEIPDLPDWSDFAPRFGAAYDLFGNGKTALKFSLNRYNLSRTTGLAEDYNPLGNSTATIAWTDLNGDDIAQGELGCVYRTPGCEIDLASRPASFGFVSLDRFDPDTERTWNLEHAIEVQHELLPGLSITGSWFHGSFHDRLMTDNVLITKDDWTPHTVFNPIDGSPLVIYDIKSSAKGRVDNLDRSSEDRTLTYDSFGMQFNARVRGGLTFFGGLAWERSLENTCDNPDDPNQDRFCDDANLPGFKVPYRGQLKLAASYLLPWSIQLSGSFQSNPGAAALINGLARLSAANVMAGSTRWLLSSTTRYPTTCEKCPGGVPPWQPNQLVLSTLTGTPSSANLEVPLIPWDSDDPTSRTERINQLDLRINKSFTVRGVRLMPQLEIYNVFNADTIILYRSINFGTSTYQQPSGILNGRIIGMGMQARW